MGIRGVSSRFTQGGQSGWGHIHTKAIAGLEYVPTTGIAGLGVRSCNGG